MDWTQAGCDPERNEKPIRPSSERADAPAATRERGHRSLGLAGSVGAKSRRDEQTAQTCAIACLHQPSFWHAKPHF